MTSGGAAGAASVGASTEVNGGACLDARAPIDVRLAAGAVGAWLALICCIGKPPAAVALVGVVVCAVAAGALLSGGRRPDPRAPISPDHGAGTGARIGRAIALVGFCVALVLLPYAGRLTEARASPLVALAAQRSVVTVDATVTEDPRLLAATGVAGSPRVAVRTDAIAVVMAGRRWSVSSEILVLAPAGPWRGVLPGQRVRLDGLLQPSLESGLTGVTLLSRSNPVLVGRPPWWQRAAGGVRGSLRQASSGLPPAERGLLPGLIDGDTTGLDPVLAERFRIAGLTHLVAVSGTNCSILVGALLLVLRRLRVRPTVCAVAGAVLLMAFVVVARPSPSVLRSALMAAIALVSLASGRPRQAIPTLAAAVLTLLVWDPSLATDAGFTMSVLATSALLLIAPGWAETLRRHRVPAGVAEAVAVAAAAHLVTAPVIVAISGRVSLVAIPANVLAEPAVPVVTVLGFVAAAVSPLWLGGGRVAAELAGWPCRWLVWVADRLGSLRGAALPWPGGTTGGLALLGVTAALILLGRRAGLGRLMAVGAVLGTLVQIPMRSVAPGWPPPGWLMVACDVGQGDAIVLAAGAHAAVEIDAGPDPITIDRCLRDLGIADVAMVVLTHFHLDHVGGIVGVLHDRHVGRVVTGPVRDPISGVRLVDDTLAAHGLTATTLPVRSSVNVGGLHLDVLGPDAAFHNTRSDPNNSSLVLRATVRGTSILLPGDAEIEAQQAMLDAGTDLRADVLKVPHHGSAYSDPRFLAAAHARIGVISVGVHNDYGHPSPVLLNELDRLAVPTRRTDRDGDVAVVDSGGRLATVARGVAASSLAAGPLVAGTGARRRAAGVGTVAAGAGSVAAGPAARPPEAVSAPDARMGPWQRDPSASTSCLIRFRPLCFSSAMRSFWSVGQSARSPPSASGVMATWMSRSGPVLRSRVRNCTKCSGRRSSVMPGCWSSLPRRTCG